MFERALMDGLRMVRGNARDMILPPPGSEELVFLARRLGYADKDWAQAAHRLLEDTRGHMQRAHAFYVRRFGQAPVDTEPVRLNH